MNWNQTVLYIKKDIYRSIGDYSIGLFWKTFFSGASTVNLLIHYRLCHYFIGKGNKPFYYLFLIKFKKLQVRCGIELNPRTEIGYGLRLPHRGSIVIHPNTKIGNNCEIMSCVTIGNNILKDRDAVATIGDNVMICTGARVIGNVSIGNDVIIGANSVVNKDIREGTIVAGIPAKEIKDNDNMDYLINTEYKPGW
ncbi:serine O-acetyltransferase [Butyrivibrio proteoclasticus]|uniref:serine O-acetyltransferase n=1 Tax=Butyrivibrio proteoclasticus TaxID=43305 RepID=UPI000685345B|nr:serine acetyltransferase [Butyrivibrio proteoclasticus]